MSREVAAASGGSPRPPSTAARGRTARAAGATAMSAQAASPAVSQLDGSSHLRSAVARQLSVSEDEAAQRLRQLAALLPDLGSQVDRMDPAVVARLAADVGAVTRRLLQLRVIFPEADAFKLALRAPVLVLGASRPRLERAAKQLRRLLPGLNVDRLVEDEPELLDVKALRGALKDFKRAEPELDVAQALQLDPSMVFRFSLRHGRPNLDAALSRRTAAMLAVVPVESG